MGSEELNELKQSLRRKVLAGREKGHNCGHAHSNSLIEYVAENRIRSVACYLSFGDEPNTNVFVRHCQLDEKIQLYIPRVVGDDLEWVAFSEDQIRHKLGMSEPIGPAVNLREIELLVVPAIAVDRHGNRLGRGKGYFDRALSAIAAKEIVAVVHDDEIFDEVPTEAHDQRVQLICSCENISAVKIE